MIIQNLLKITIGQVLWQGLVKSMRRKRPQPVIKSLLFATKLFATLSGITSLNVFTLALLVITVGELCLSPIGLSIMTKLATKNLQGVMMGMWFLASAYGQYVAGIIGAGLSKAKEGASKLEILITYTEGYKQLGLYSLIAGIILIFFSSFLCHF